MICPMRLAGGGDNFECLGERCMWYTTIRSDVGAIESCTMAFIPLSIAMENTGVLVSGAGDDGEDAE